MEFSLPISSRKLINNRVVVLFASQLAGSPQNMDPDLPPTLTRRIGTIYPGLGLCQLFHAAVVLRRQELRCVERTRSYNAAALLEKA